MTGGQKRPELVSASATKHDRADDLLGAVVPLRAYYHVDAPSPESDLSNVIPFAPRGRKASDKATKAPAVECALADRPAPDSRSKDRRRQIALLIGGSLLVHGVIFAAFNREPEPHASIGVISISAEIVLGAQTEAGLSTRASESQAVEAPKRPDVPIDNEIERARKDVTEKPVDEPKEARKEKTETAAPKIQEALPADAPPEVKEAELVATPKPAEKPALTAAPEQKKPEAKEAKEKKVREAARHAKDDGEGKRDRAPASTPSAASSGIGRGRSDLTSNYPGIVFAHLARYKRPFDGPAGAKAMVTFSLNDSGNVTSVRLSRSSGAAALDQEVLATVRRASPFPAPPRGVEKLFTVPFGVDRR
jgi:periplasmic protein TonB